MPPVAAPPTDLAAPDVDPEAPTRVTTFSPSAAALWGQCPRRWWLKYVERLPEPPPGEPAVLGTFVHRILELLLADEPAARTTDRARVLAREAWAEVEASDEWLALELDEIDGLRFRQRAWATVEAYFACESPASVEPVARELEVRVDLAGVPFRGYIDLVERRERGVVITDYKTGKPPVQGKAWSAEQEVEKLWQPQWYAAALTELGEHDPVRARLLYFSAQERMSNRGFVPRTGELTVDITTESREGALVELRRRWDDVNDAYEHGGADASPGPLCGWCPFVDVCAEGQAECQRRWNETNEYTGGRRLRADAPAVALLGLAQPA